MARPPESRRTKASNPPDEEQSVFAAGLESCSGRPELTGCATRTSVNRGVEVLHNAEQVGERFYEPVCAAVSPHV